MALKARALEELNSIISYQTNLVISKPLKVATIFSDLVALILNVKFF